MRFFKDVKDGVISVFKGKAHKDNIYNLNGRVPLGHAIVFGIQHVLAMFIANIAPILVVFGVIGLSNEYPELASRALRGAIFVAGIGTIIQVLLGARLPIVIGTSFTFAGLFISVGLNVKNGGGTSLDAYNTILACILVGSLFVSIMGPFVKWWGKLIKPITTSCVVLGIGLSLLQVGAQYFVGGSNVLASNNLTVIGTAVMCAMIALLCGILWKIFIPGVWKNLNIIVGIIIGYVAAIIFNSTFCPGLIDFSTLSVTKVTDVIDIPRLIDFSKLRFEPVPIILSCLVFLVATVEGIGDSSAVCFGGLNRDITNRELAGALTTDGVSSFLAGIFGSLPLTTFSQNVGIVVQTKIVNRFSIFVGACFLTICGFFPIISNFILTIPECVLGGSIIIVFGSITVTGMNLIKEQGFTEKNITITSLAVCLGFGITLVTDLFNALSNGGEVLNNISIIISNPVINMFIIAMILSWTLPESMAFNKKKQQ